MNESVVRTADPKVCQWTHDRNDDSNMWETTCGKAFCLNCDTPKRNGFRFCCYCGAKLKQVTVRGY